MGKNTYMKYYVILGEIKVKNFTLISMIMNLKQ